MLDISNKLHALVDEFVSHLSSECDSLANNALPQTNMYHARDRAPQPVKAARPSNRTASEVLNGLKRPSGESLVDIVLREGQSPQPPAKANLKDALRRSRNGGRSSQPYEILSSDHSSDDCRRPASKFSKKLPGNQRGPKMRNSRPRGRSPGIGTPSHAKSPESSHSLDYSYEGDTKSVGEIRLDVETNFQKLRWPQDIEDLLEDAETEKHFQSNDAPGPSQSHKRNGGVQCNDDIILPEGDESTEDEFLRNPVGTEYDVEELPVLPKVPVKRRLLNEPGASQRRTRRGKTKSSSPQIKKHKTPQIDASVITQLYFARRPANSVSTTTMLL